VTVFRTRRTLPTDEPDLNAVYNQITGGTRVGKARSLEEMHWIWHQAPGGATDSWIVEAQLDGGWKIVGHHALCPIRFTLKDEDWLCAKTINTFLLPEFRDQFLYLRFERECLDVAETRFDVTYSAAPGAARLRKALGYDTSVSWIRFERGFQPQHLIARAITALAGRYSHIARLRLSKTLTSISAVPTENPPIELTEHSAGEVNSSGFFRDFWSEARATAGLAPRRDIADLEWRFWKRPGFEGSILTYTWPGDGRAYCIVDTSNPIGYSLADFFITPASPKLFDRLLDALFVWCARRGALALKFSTTTDGLPPQLMEVAYHKMKLFPLRRYMLQSDLPRRLTPLARGRCKGTLPKWNATEILTMA
jgi:hypothetical protein